MYYIERETPDGWRPIYYATTLELAEYFLRFVDAETHRITQGPPPQTICECSRTPTRGNAAAPVCGR